MSTTRHLINRRRRLAAAPPARTPRGGTASDTALALLDTPPRPGRDEPDESGRQPASGRPRVTRWALLLAVLSVLLGGLAGYAESRARSVHADSATANSALTDAARTSEVKGAVTAEVNAIFSYDYTATARTDSAAQHDLTGRAVQQYAALLATVRARAQAQKLVLTTTVTYAGVESLGADRARVLVFADQSNTSAVAARGTAPSTYAAAMFAADVVRQDGNWKIAAIDTFTG